MPTVLTRRATLLALAAAFAPGAALAARPVLQVARDPNCGCCEAWVNILEAEGFATDMTLMDPDALEAHKTSLGLPEAMRSCHTAEVEGYVIEGHVPPADIRRLLATRPEALGLAVPGMPMGSPGMGPETSREAYDVYLILKDGKTEVFASYAAA